MIQLWQRNSCKPVIQRQQKMTWPKKYLPSFVKIGGCLLADESVNDTHCQSSVPALLWSHSSWTFSLALTSSFSLPVFLFLFKCLCNEVFAGLAGCVALWSCREAEDFEPDAVIADIPDHTISERSKKSQDERDRSGSKKQVFHFWQMHNLGTKYNSAPVML